MQEGHDRQSDRGDPVTPPSEKLARRFRRGDPSAVQLVRKRVGRILSWQSLAIPEQERADLEQEVMTQIWQAVNRTRFDFTAGFWGFVEIVTSRRSIDWLRGQREKVGLPDDLESAALGPVERSMNRERAELAAGVLAALAPRCRKLIEQRLRDGLTYREIAETGDRSEGALRVQFYRCIRQARQVAKRLGVQIGSGRRPEGFGR